MSEDSTMLTSRELAIRARCDAATGAPWEAYADTFDDAAGAAHAAAVCLMRGGNVLHAIVAGESVAEVRKRVDATPPYTDLGTVITSIVGNGPNSGNNAAFLSYARTDVPYLLGEVDRLRGMLVEIAKASPEIAEHIMATLVP